MRKMKFRLITLIVAFIMAFTVMPIMGTDEADAAESEAPAIGLGPGLLKTNAGKAGAQILKFGTLDWPVISYDGKNGDGEDITYYTAEGNWTNIYRRGAVTLLSPNAYENSIFRKKYMGQDWSNAYDGSELQAYIRSWEYGGERAKFNSQENLAINYVNLKGGNVNFGESGWDKNKIKGNSTVEKLWPLSYAEAVALPNELLIVDNAYNLRSPERITDAAYVFEVNTNGNIYAPNTVRLPNGVRPALDINMNAIQFVSTADGSNKYQSNSAGYIKATGKNTTGKWKLTLKDDGTVPGLDGHDKFSVDKVEWIYGNSMAQITYSGATTGENEQITGIVAVGDQIRYCGKIGDCTDSSKRSGTVVVKPYDMHIDGAKLYILNEKVNPDGNTDLASSLIEITDVPHEVTGHKWVDVDKKDPTCTESGNPEGVTCTVCNKHMAFVQISGGKLNLVDVSDEEWNIPATGHTEVTDEGINPTCTEAGKTEGKHCSVCNEVLLAQSEVPAKDHDWGEWKQTKAPACEDTGKEERVCSRDQSHKEERDIDATGHTEVTDEGVNPTCTEAGKTEGKHCSVCNEVLLAQSEIPAKDHDWGKWTTLDAEQHQRVCEHDANHIEKANHTWDAGKVTKAATEQTEGTKTFTCSVCSGTKTEIIPKLTPTPDPEKQYGTDGTPVGPGASDKAAEKAITSSTSDKDIKGSKFAPLKLKSTKQGKTSMKLSWTKNKKAVKYVVYGNLCNAKGKKYKPVKIATAKGGSYNVKKIKKAKVKKGRYYKLIVVALDKNNKVVSTSKTIHVATKGGKVGNHKSVTVKAKMNAKGKATRKYQTLSKTVLKKGKSLKLIVKLNPAAKKLKVKKHVGLRYETTNAKVAIVSGGKIKAKGKGTCYIFAYAQNGVAKAIKVTVK